MLPALTNGKTGYDGLEIHEGTATAASNEYMRIITFGNNNDNDDNHGASEQDEKTRVRAAAPMLEYCKQDTNGMIDILKVLQTAAL